MDEGPFRACQRTYMRNGNHLPATWVPFALADPSPPGSLPSRLAHVDPIQGHFRLWLPVGFDLGTLPLKTGVREGKRSFSP